MLDYGGLVPVLAAADVLAGQTTEKRRCARRQATHVQAGRQASRLAGRCSVRFQSARAAVG